MSCKVLYVSGSLGLGHVTRDLAIAAEMRQMCPEVDSVWIAGSPASEVLEAAGERLVPEQVTYRGETDLAEAVARSGRLSLTAYVFRALTAWFHNARLIGNVASQGKFDVIAGNETYEIPVTNFFGMRVLPAIPFVMMYDFWGMEVTSGNMFEKVGAWLLNLVWTQEWRVTARGQNAAIFFGEIKDLPDRPFGVLLPNRRRYAEKHVEFVGYPLQFTVKDVPQRDFLRRELGYDDGPLVICTVGGTSIGRDLLELCGRTFPLVTACVPGLRMVIVAGPRITRNLSTCLWKSTAERWCPSYGATWLPVIWQLFRAAARPRLSLRHCTCPFCFSRRTRRWLARRSVSELIECDNGRLC